MNVLEIGSKDGWVGAYLASKNVVQYKTVDLVGPADYVGDIRNYKALGIPESFFDIVIAFEVIEHVECAREIAALLKDGGQLLLTTPHPHWDWLCFVLEQVGLSQKRTSSHVNLVNLKKTGLAELKPELIKRVGIMSQWGIFVKPTRLARGQS
jgi:hypothetical protein